ncbi:unnamed protein product, partial [Allacma fusca]
LIERQYFYREHRIVFSLTLSSAHTHTIQLIIEDQEGTVALIISAV